MSETVAGLGDAIKLVWKPSLTERLDRQKLFWKRWSEFQRELTPLRDNIKARLLGQLCPRFYVLLNPETAGLTRRIWSALGTSGECLSHAALAKVIEDEVGVTVGGSEWLASVSHYFFAGLLMFRYVRPIWAEDEGLQYRLDLGWATDETLRVQLFGFLFSIPGFNDVFGGALLMQRALRSAKPPADLPDLTQAQLQGRLVLVEGPFGVGKSILAWRMAADFVAEGGCVYFHAPEQTLNECLYALTSVDASVDLRQLPCSHSLKEFETERPSAERGHLVFVAADELSVDNGCNDEGEEAGGLGSAGIFSPLIKLFSQTEAYDLRVCILDPMNAFLDEQLRRTKIPRADQLRYQTANLIREAKRHGVNLLITCEKNHDAPAITHYFEHLADTTIRLGYQRMDDNVSRSFLEVPKSRFQGQLSGKHRLSIRPGAGLRIYTAIESFERLIPGPSVRSQKAIDMGIPGLFRSLGPSGVQSGHIVAVTGPGKYKTVTGLHFLVGGWWNSDASLSAVPDKPVGEPNGISRLMISDMPVHEMEEIARGVYGRESYDTFRRYGLGFLQIPNGPADPGEVLSVIRERLQGIHTQGGKVERAMVFTLSRIEETTPALRDNDLFGVLLLKLFRGFAITTLIVNSDERCYGISRFRDVILEECDVRIDFDRKYYYEREQTIITTIRTPSSNQLRDFFCLNRRPSGRLSVDVSPYRISPSDDQLLPIPTKIFLHAETQNHVNYHEGVIQILKRFSNPGLEGANRLPFEIDLLTEAPTATPKDKLIDEAQVIQLDEFEIPDREDALQGSFMLFDVCGNESLLAHRHPKMRERVEIPKQAKFFAVPYYLNCSVLALSKQAILDADNSSDPKIQNPFFKPDGNEERDPEVWSWSDIAKYVFELQEFRKLNQHELAPQELAKVLVFSCPVYEGNVETYNSFYFEVLQSLLKFTSRESGCGFLDWIGSEEAKKAAFLFRRLCYLSHKYFFPNKHKPKALISRHWYNTLNQEIERWSVNSRNDLHIRPLPGGLTTWGEWYLGVPKGSHSPELALEVIKYMCSEKQENQRRYAGVGLPTIADFYRDPSGKPYPVEYSVSVSPYCEFRLQDLNSMIGTGFRRSAIACYQSIRSTISAHLRWILELPYEDSEKKDKDAVYRIVDGMRNEVRTIQSHERCSRCAFMSHGDSELSNVSSPRLN